MTAPPAVFLPPVMSDVVIDISHHQNVSQDFSAASASGIKAVILKATQGTGFVDHTFLPRVVEARAAGLLVGAYHFLDGSNPAQQVAHFLTVALSEGGVKWLALDWEAYPPSQATLYGATQAAASLNAATGSWPVLYTGRYMLPAASTTLSRCACWLAEYGTRPICPPGWLGWRLWQHTDRGIAPGIGPCDRSRFAGTDEELRSWWLNPAL